MNQIKIRKKNLNEKLSLLKKQIEKLKQARKKEIGDLAVKAGLEEVENDILLASFKKLAEEIESHD
jgi:hypothetical protein